MKTPETKIKNSTSVLSPHLNGNTPDSQPDDESFWTTYPAGEYGNAQVFLEIHGNDVAYNSAHGWLCKKPECWVKGDLAESRLDQDVIDTLLERQRRAAAIQNDAIASKSACTTRNVNNVKAMIRPYVTVLPDEFDNDPNLLNTRRGVIDLRNGRIVADESSKFTYCCPVEYDPDADCTAWLDWLDQTIAQHRNNADLRDWFQMCMGYSVTGHTREECLFYLHGPTRGGKGTLNQVQLSMLGDPLGRGADFSTFTRKRDGNSFDLAPLKAARLIVASEGQKKVSLNAAMVKNITGRDLITCAFKGKDEFSYIPNYKIWLASNHAVSGDPDDDAFWNRIKVVSCPWSKSGMEDKELKARMTTPEYLRAVLAYTVLGAKMWWNSPTGLITPESVRNTTQAHRDASDSVGQWLAENVAKDKDPDNFISHSLLHIDYKNWCEDNGFTPKMGKSFGESMATKGFPSDRAYINLNGKNTQVRGYKGLKFL